MGKVGRDAGSNLCGWGWGGFQVAAHDFVFIGAFKRPASGEHFVQGDANRVQIGALIDRQRLDLLRRHVVDRAEQRTGVSEARRRSGAAMPKSVTLTTPSSFNRMLGGLMSRWIILGDGHGQRRQDLQDYADARGGIERAAAYGCVEAPPFDEFHDHEISIAVAQRGMQAGDIGMNQGGVHFDFAQKAIAHARVGHHVGTQDLHRVHAIRDQVADAKHFAHAAGAQFAQDFVVADRVPHLQVHLLSISNDSENRRPIDNRPAGCQPNVT